MASSETAEAEVVLNEEDAPGDGGKEGVDPAEDADVTIRRGSEVFDSRVAPDGGLEQVSPRGGDVEAHDFADQFPEKAKELTAL
jgi:hypothetical protein